MKDSYRYRVESKTEKRNGAIGSPKKLNCQILKEKLIELWIPFWIISCYLVDDPAVSIGRADSIQRPSSIRGLPLQLVFWAIQFYSSVEKGKDNENECLFTLVDCRVRNRSGNEKHSPLIYIKRVFISFKFYSLHNIVYIHIYIYSVERCTPRGRSMGTV